MTLNPLVSVILAVRNGERFLANAIESIIATMYPRMEIILIDGHSTDESCSIAARYPQVQIVTQDGFGISNAYNQGVTLARGEFVAFNSSDDIWSADKLDKQVDVLVRNPDVGIATGKSEFFLEPGTAVPDGFRQELLDSPPTAYIMETVLVRHDVFDHIGPFEPALRTAEDVDWFARVRDAGVKCVAVDAVVVRKRIHGDNSSLSKSNTGFLLAALRNSVQRKQRVGSHV